MFKQTLFKKENVEDLTLKRPSAFTHNWICSVSGFYLDSVSQVTFVPHRLNVFLQIDIVLSIRGVAAARELTKKRFLALFFLSWETLIFNRFFKSFQELLFKKGW